MLLILPFVFLFQSVVPPGTVRVKNYYVDKTEILNTHWLEYIHHRGKELDSTELVKLYPDTANHWYQSPAHRNYPVVFITHEQASEYCSWRTRVVSEQTGKKVTYRLPSADEWKEIAAELLLRQRRQLEKDLKNARKQVAKETGRYYMIDMNKADGCVHHLFDNVSEMTYDKNIAMGSNNYELFDLDKNISGVIMYDSPNAYLGFRCIAEIE